MQGSHHRWEHILPVSDTLYRLSIFSLKRMQARTYNPEHTPFFCKTVVKHVETQSLPLSATASSVIYTQQTWQHLIKFMRCTPMSSIWKGLCNMYVLYSEHRMNKNGKAFMTLVYDLSPTFPTCHWKCISVPINIRKALAFVPAKSAKTIYLYEVSTKLVCIEGSYHQLHLWQTWLKSVFDKN